MAKTTASTDDHRARTSHELKRELKMVMKVVVGGAGDVGSFVGVNGGSNDDDGGGDVVVAAIDRARELLACLKELRLKGGGGGGGGGGAGGGDRMECFERVDVVDDDDCPPEFRCPLSKHIMYDPVIISTGQTYDKPFIQRWLKAGHRACPLTQQVLSHTLLTPNYLVKDMISQWCKARGVEMPVPNGCMSEDGEGTTEGDRAHFLTLLNKMSKSMSEQKAAAKELRLLTKRMPSFRALFGDSKDVIHQLVKPIMERSEILDQGLREDVITTILNISIHDSNKKQVAETPGVISLLIDALRCGTPETRSNSAAALFTLSALDSNKALIGKSGAMKPLVDLLDEGHPMAMKDAASAIFNLCIIRENKGRAVEDGLVKVLIGKIECGVHVDELLAILAMLSTNQKAVEEMAQFGAVPSLLSIMRSSSCARNKENCIAILYTICSYDRTKLREMREEERGYGSLSKLASDGTSRAMRKANGILERLNRAFNVTHTA